MKDLQKHVEQIARNLETGFPDEKGIDDQEFGAFDYLQDALDIEYRVGSDGQYRSAKILVAFGGPNIWVDTADRSVYAAWWGDRATAYYSEDAMDIDGACAELWSCR